MSLRDTFTDLADSLFIKFSDFVVTAIYVDTASAYSTITGIVTAATETSISVVILAPGSDTGAKLNPQSGAIAERVAIAKNLDFRPEVGRRLRVDGWDYEILGVSDQGSSWIVVEMTLGAAVPMTANP